MWARLETHFAVGFALPGRDAFAAGGFVFGGTLLVFRRNAFCLSAGRFLPFGGMLLAFRRDAFAAGVFARRGSIPSCEGHFPSSHSSPPATQFAAGCGNVYVYRRGDGFYGIECGSLCRFLFALDEMRPAWQACFCCFLGPVLFVINFNQIK